MVFRLSPAWGLVEARVGTECPMAEPVEAGGMARGCFEKTSFIVI